jgi:hypothetical protein
VKLHLVSSIVSTRDLDFLHHLSEEVRRPVLAWDPVLRERLFDVRTNAAAEDDFIEALDDCVSSDITD